MPEKTYSWINNDTCVSGNLKNLNNVCWQISNSFNNSRSRSFCLIQTLLLFLLSTFPQYEYNTGRLEQFLVPQYRYFFHSIWYHLQYLRYLHLLLSAYSSFVFLFISVSWRRNEKCDHVILNAYTLKIEEKF